MELILLLWNVADILGLACSLPAGLHLRDGLADGPHRLIGLEGLLARGETPHEVRGATPHCLGSRVTKYIQEELGNKLIVFGATL